MVFIDCLSLFKPSSSSKNCTCTLYYYLYCTCTKYYLGDIHDMYYRLRYLSVYTCVPVFQTHTFNTAQPRTSGT